MKIKFNVLCAGAVLITAMIFSENLSGQDNSVETRTYPTDEFTGIFLEGAYGVELIQGNTHLVEVRASDPRAFDYLNITNTNGLLHVNVDRKPFDFKRITVYITFERLTWLRIFGSIRLETCGYLDLNKIEMSLEGGAKAKLQVKAREIYLDNKGGVLVELLGVTDILNMRLAGTGHINAAELKASEVDFTIEGVGTGKVYAVNTLKATIKGAGKIRYIGNPDVRENIEGLGSVSRE